MTDSVRLYPASSGFSFLSRSVRPGETTARRVVRLRPLFWKIFNHWGDVLICLLINTSAPSHWLKSVAWPVGPVLKFRDIPDWSVNSRLPSQSERAKNTISTNWYHYSFKIFFRFWLAKIPLIIHHDQLLSTKFGRISRYVNWWRQLCSKLPGHWIVNRENLRSLGNKMGERFTRFTRKK